MFCRNIPNIPRPLDDIGTRNAYSEILSAIVLAQRVNTFAVKFADSSNNTRSSEAAQARIEHARELERILPELSGYHIEQSVEWRAIQSDVVDLLEQTLDELPQWELVNNTFSMKRGFINELCHHFDLRRLEDMRRALKMSHAHLIHIISPTNSLGR